MFKTTDLGRTLAAIACTLVFSTLCVVGAVGPAQADATHPIVRVVA